MARLGAAVVAIGALVVLFVSLASARSGAAGDPALVQIGTFSAPIYVTAPPGDGGRVFVVEKAGRIRVVKNGATLGTPFLDLTGPVRSSEYERGLLSMAFAPDYPTTGLFYVYYTADSPLGALTIAEYRRSAADPDVADPGSGRIVLSIDHPGQDNHNGGQLQFGPDGYLYIGTGDGGGANDPNSNAQNQNVLLGKLLRIDPRLSGTSQYTFPASNPFVGVAGKRPEIWAYGLRNPWRFSFDRQTGDLAIGDVGQNDWEEIDFATVASGGGKGLNFGWKCYEGKHTYSNNPPHCSPRPPQTPPVHEYANPARGCSITGGYVVRDPTLPALAGRYVYADGVCDAAIWSLQLPNSATDAKTGLAVSDAYSFGEDGCGRVYVASGGGAVQRLYASGSVSPATCTPWALPPPPPPQPPPGPPGPPPPPSSPPPPPPAAAKRCNVPRVIGMTLARAKARIRRANCRVGRVRRVKSKRRFGRVASQKPRPGRRLARGTRVHVNVSRGRRAFALASVRAGGDPKLVQVGRFSAPVYVAAPAGDRRRFFVVEQPGRILVVKDGATLARPFLDIRSLVSFGGERGLLSMAFPPDYATSGRFYVYYTARSPSGALTIAEFRSSPGADRADAATRRTILSISHPRGNHNGGQLQFGPDGYLWIGTGDGGGAGDPDLNGQKLDSLLGKLLRIDPRAGTGAAAYTVPTDNPFVGQAGRRAEIWSYGLRNPWRFSFDRQTGDLTIGDVGQGSWEEIDFSPTSAGRGRGANFGWGCWEGRHVFDDNSNRPGCSPRPSQVPPAAEYSHSRGCSITGGYVVRDPTLPALAGRYVYGDYCRAPLWSVRLQAPDAQDDRRLGLDVPGLSSFGEDACGRVYAISGDGPVYRLEPEGRPAGSLCPAARPAPRCRVPKVVGLRLRTERTRIRRANCRVGRVRYARSARARGRVTRQSPRAGARRAGGARVNLTVSRGRR